MHDIHNLVNEFVVKLRKRQIEGSKATAKQTAELLRSFISSMHIPNTDQAGALIDAVKIVGEQIITASPVAAVGCMNLSGESDDEIVDEDDHPVLSVAAVAAAAAAATARSTLRPPSLQTLLEDMPHSADIPHSTSSGCDSEGKSKYTDKNSRSRKLKHNVIEAVNEPIQDVSTMLWPLYPHNPEVLLNELKSPADLLEFGEFSDCMDFGNGDGSSLLQVVNPVFDYVPPKLVNLFITDTGGHNPSYM